MNWKQISKNLLKVAYQVPFTLLLCSVIWMKYSKKKQQIHLMLMQLYDNVQEDKRKLISYYLNNLCRLVNKRNLEKI